MEAYEVKQGDSISSIAFAYGFFPGTLWDLPENAALKELRVTGDILLPGDVVRIPDLRPEAIDKPTARRHRFKRLGVPAKLRLQFLGDDGPRAGKPYVLTIDGVRREGVTDGDGVLEVFIPPDARAGEVEIEGEVYPLELGTLDPITELSGVKKRLNNLGFFSGDPAAPADETFAAALGRFQRDTGLPDTGALDDATRAKLAEVHDARGDLSSDAEEAS